MMELIDLLLQHPHIVLGAACCYAHSVVFFCINTKVIIMKKNWFLVTCILGFGALGLGFTIGIVFLIWKLITLL